jgi:hypothetical protein
MRLPTAKHARPTAARMVSTRDHKSGERRSIIPSPYALVDVL